ncbi:hypothetical protein ACUY3H_04480 [Corynebacterium ureicelerivorans]
MTTNVTPEHARELLDTANRGETDGERPVTVAAKYAPLAEAAYALAQTVANLHYEYAVQNAETGKWVREGGGVLIYTSGPSAADWNTDLEETQNFEEWITDETRTAHRVVRRLVSDPEVVE